MHRKFVFNITNISLYSKIKKKKIYEYCIYNYQLSLLLKIISCLILHNLVYTYGANGGRGRGRGRRNGKDKTKKLRKKTEEEEEEERKVQRN